MFGNPSKKIYANEWCTNYSILCKCRIGCYLQFPEEVQACSALHLLSVDEERDGEEDHDYRRHPLQVNGCLGVVSSYAAHRACIHVEYIIILRRYVVTDHILKNIKTSSCRTYFVLPGRGGRIHRKYGAPRFMLARFVFRYMPSSTDVSKKERKITGQLVYIHSPSL